MPLPVLLSKAATDPEEVFKKSGFSCTEGEKTNIISSVNPPRSKDSDAAVILPRELSCCCYSSALAALYNRAPAAIACSDEPVSISMAWS